MITKQEIINAGWDSNEYPNYEYKDTVAKILEEYEILGGSIDGDGTEEQMYVLMRKDGRLYEFISNHCSCDGFADFEPEEVQLEALLMRKKTEYSGGIGNLTHSALEESGLLSSKI